MEYIWNIFGSSSSKDIDILLKVDTIPVTQESHELIKSVEPDFVNFFQNNNDFRKINLNLITTDYNTITNCFKGTSDEVNNSLYYTYSNFVQTHPNFVKVLLERNIVLKVIRVSRVILSFASRTHQRNLIKPLLKDSLINQWNFLPNIDINNLPDKKETYEDMIKVIFFQLGQIKGLLNNIELYSKEDIIKNYPNYANPILRIPGDYTQLYLEEIKIIFAQIPETFYTFLENRHD